MKRTSSMYLLALLLILSWFTTESSFAQTPYVKKWDRTYGSSGTGNPLFSKGQEHIFNRRSLLVDTSTYPYRLLIGGTTVEGTGGDKLSPYYGGVQDMWVLYLDQNGSLIWEKGFGSFSLDAGPALLTKNNKLFMVGAVDAGVGGTVSKPNLGNSMDYWFCEFDKNGNVLFDERYGGYYHESFVFLVEVGNLYLLTGYVTFNSEFNTGRRNDISEPARDDLSLPLIKTDDKAPWRRSDIWMIAIDESGVKQWDKRFGGLSSDRPMDVLATPDGGLLVGGVTDSPVSSEVTHEPLGRSDVWIIKTNDRGVPQWDRRFGGSERDTVHQIVNLDNGNYLLVCTSQSEPGIAKTAPNIGGHDVWLIEMDDQGTRVREWVFGGTGDERRPRLIRRHDGGWLLACWSKSDVSGLRTVSRKGTDDVWVLGLDNQLAIQWDQCFGGDRLEMLGGLQATPDSGYVLLCTSTSDQSFDKSEDHRPGARTGDFWVLKIGPDKPLALNRLSFDLQNLERSVLLSWSQDDEQDTWAYVLERSRDLKHWESIDTVEITFPGIRGRGEYSRLDRYPLSGRSFYRLRIEEQLGRLNYSNILEVYREGGLGGIGVELSIFPVPFYEELRLSYYWDESHELRVSNVHGAEVNRLTLPSGEQELRIDTSDWSAGLYWIEVYRSGRRVDVRRVIKI